MANTRELRRRIKSVKNTSQITKAMQMVAATKMRRAQNQALSSRPYNLLLNLAISNLLPKINSEQNILLQENTEGVTGIVLISTNKSLCGALNTNLFRATQSFLSDKKNLKFFSIGLKGKNFVVKSGKDLVADFENPEVTSFRQATQIAKLLVDQFLKKEIKEAYLIFPDFISTLRQEPKIIKLLPISILDFAKFGSENIKNPKTQSDFLFEPNISELLDYTLNHFLQTQIYQALLETKASEHSARMIAMQNATDNAKELVQDLKLSYNQTRQSSITTELLEITSAQLALE